MSWTTTVPSMGGALVQVKREPHSDQGMMPIKLEQNSPLGKQPDMNSHQSVVTSIAGSMNNGECHCHYHYYLLLRSLNLKLRIRYLLQVFSLSVPPSKARQIAPSNLGQNYRPGIISFDRKPEPEKLKCKAFLADLIVKSNLRACSGAIRISIHMYRYISPVDFQRSDVEKSFCKHKTE